MPTNQPFDAYRYIQSSAAQPRPLRRFPDLAWHALRLAHRASPRLFWINAALQLVVAVTLALQVLLGKLAIDAVLQQSDSGDVGPAIAPLVGLAAATAFSTLATSAQTQLQRLLGEHVQLITWTNILDVTTTVPLETFEDPEFFDALQRVQANALIRPLTMSQGLVALAGGAISSVGLIITLAAIQPVLVPLMLLAGVPLWLLSRATGRLEFRFNAEQTPTLRMRRYLADLLSGRDEAKEIRSFALGPVLYDRWRDNYARYLHAFRRHIMRRLSLATASALVTTLVLSVSLGLLVWFVVDGSIALASAGAAIIAIRLLSTRLQQTFTGVGDIFESALFLRDFDEFTHRADHLAVEQGDVGPPVAPFQELRVDGVTFRYPGGREPALRDVSLTLRAGEVVALVGENGSGKTTLAKLLAHVYAPTQGRLLWDGIDTRQLDARSLRAHIGVIFQDFVRYQLSARENVGFGRAELLDDDAAIEQAARRGGAHDFLARLPDGYASGLGKEYMGGHDLSLGQWQRVALARAFFRDAHLLVLDEPTASLDARSEHALFEQVRNLAAGRCLLLISHRFSTVKEADRIYVLHQGELLEQGSHEELMARGGHYAEMFELQAEKYR